MDYEELISYFHQPVMNTNKLWISGHTKQWFNDNGYPIFTTDDKNNDIKVKHKYKHGTSYQNNSTTYERLGAYIQNELYPFTWQEIRILDASSGRGLGTETLRKMGFTVEDIEPFYPNREDKTGSGQAPTYTDYEQLIKNVYNGKIERYDFIISNAVLNVLTQDDRDYLTKVMCWLLKPKGYLFINAPNNSKWKPKLNDDGTPVMENLKEIITPSVSIGNKTRSGAEYYAWRTNSPQKSFNHFELSNYLFDAVGKDNYIIKNFSGSSKYPCSSATIVQKIKEDE